MPNREEQRREFMTLPVASVLAFSMTRSLTYQVASPTALFWAVWVGLFIAWLETKYSVLQTERAKTLIALSLIAVWAVLGLIRVG